MAMRNDTAGLLCWLRGAASTTRYGPDLFDLRPGLTQDFRDWAEAPEIRLEPDDARFIRVGCKTDRKPDDRKGDGNILLQGDAAPIERGFRVYRERLDGDPIALRDLVQDHVGAADQGSDHRLERRRGHVGAAARLGLVDDDFMHAGFHVGACMRRASALKLHLRRSLFTNDSHRWLSHVAGGGAHGALQNLERRLRVIELYRDGAFVHQPRPDREFSRAAGVHRVPRGNGARLGERLGADYHHAVAFPRLLILGPMGPAANMMPCSSSDLWKARCGPIFAMTGPR